ncbi:PspC domain-containing protein [Flavobacterium sp.]|jgi:phage shock protein PspC (stress-responsive transcriptional regulator)|uniref:PspC domain-containing protein n=1 Tax=Flavobacterium sp. TaxID=239 RepID=UPI0022C6066B|nr:PspC domain-containing protein [Flavobacterium sp.]MCZ8144582.1 PspC domain-containing protein [Flavobacterium sp.]MCZ8366226.1 PspC domain-containing protein [Flavobacterium sp.]
MNKTVNINIGGLFFHIDEDAYQKLSRYFDAIKNSLTDATGKDEIMKDIEMRVAELFAERQLSDKHVINSHDVDEVVNVMGQPEDYRLDNEGEPRKETDFKYALPPRRRKLYRDEERGVIGGVCTGLGHYFGVDSFWFKLAFLILGFGTGTGFLAYLILWIAMPKAITTAEKLEMTGEPVTISNIEKKVREEFEQVSQRIQNADYNEIGEKVKYGAESFGNRLSGFITTVFGVFAKIIGAFVLIFASLSLLGVLIGAVILIFTSQLPQNAAINRVVTPIGLETPYWIQGLLFMFCFGIPLFFLMLLGLKLLMNHVRSLGNVVKYTLLAVWIVSLGALITIIINEVTQAAFDGKDIVKEQIMLQPQDTLQIRFVNNDFYAKDMNPSHDYRLTTNEQQKEVIYSNQISFEVLPTDAATPYVRIEKVAVGKTVGEANARAQKIEYGFKIEGKQLLLNNYWTTAINNKFRQQEVTVYLYLPKGVKFKTDRSVRHYDYSDNSYFNMHHSSEDYVYLVEENQVKCTNCPPDEDEYDDVIETETIEKVNDSVDKVTVKVNGVEIIREEKTGEKGSLIINKDGVVIKKSN